MVKCSPVFGHSLAASLVLTVTGHPGILQSCPHLSYGAQNSSSLPPAAWLSPFISRLSFPHTALSEPLAEEKTSTAGVLLNDPEVAALQAGTA